MTEYEYLEILALVREQTATDAMNCLVIISAYLVAAYVVGRRIPSMLLWPIAILYTLFLFGPTAATAMGFQRMNALTLDFSNQFPDSSLIEPLPTLAPYSTPGVVVAGWVLSLIFTIYIRRRGSGQGEES
jgi:hypothetical protein